jgi:16S rRNA (guanine527-N7)-methyltransferase
VIMDLTQKAAEFGLDLETHHVNLLNLYIDELESWNKKMNLTGLKTRKRIVNELVLDSLIPAPFLPHNKRMLDVGAGAGFPSIPIKIYRPHLQMTLLEANFKKNRFLKRIIRLLRLTDIKVIQGRIENSGNILHQDGYHIISARALTNLGQVIEWCSSYLLPNGLLVTFLGEQAEEELQQNANVIEENFLVPSRTIRYTLTGERKRRIVIFQKRDEK